MPKTARNIDLEHQVLDNARRHRWKIIYIEKFKSDDKVIRRFAFKKAGLPTIKVMFCDERLVGASQWYYGERMNRGKVAGESTLYRWLRAERRD